MFQEKYIRPELDYIRRQRRIQTPEEVKSDATTSIGSTRYDHKIQQPEVQRVPPPPKRVPHKRPAGMSLAELKKGFTNFSNSLEGYKKTV